MRKRTRKRTLVVESKENDEYSVTSDEIDRAIKDLTRNVHESRSIRRSGSCSRDVTCKKPESSIQLHCRQLTSVAAELRKALLRHDWEVARALLMMLTYPGLSYYASTIVRACFILLFNHPESNIDVLNEFVRLVDLSVHEQHCQKCTNYTEDEENEKFIKALFALRESGCGKYVRQNREYKVIFEEDFNDL